MSQMVGPGWLRSGLLKIVPNWLANRPGLNVGFRFLFVAALICDCIIEQLYQGWLATMPGVGTSTANPYIGYARGLTQGPNETNAAYVNENLAYLANWSNAGSVLCLAQRLQAVLGGTYTIRIVDRSGNWLTLAPNGSATLNVASWNWDGTSNPERATWWSDIWIIVYSPTFPWVTYTSHTDPNWLANWGTYNAGGYGHTVDRATVNAVNQTLHQWKAAHTWVEAIIWTTDSTLFVPGSVVAGDPDGTWGFWAFAHGPTESRTLSTAGGTVRYWIPPNGG